MASEEMDERCELDSAVPECGEDDRATGVAENAEQVDEEVKPAAAVKPELPKELEVDAPADKRPKIADPVTIGDAPEATLNVMSTCKGKVLMALADGGFQHLVAATRSSVGIKSGRYLFEVRIIESKTPADHGKVRPRQSFRLGLSTSGSSLFLGDGLDNVGFDSEGQFVSAGQWSGSNLYARGSSQGDLYGVLVNLDKQSPNGNTVSLFRNGVRQCQPQPLPESLLGKTLYPTVNYKNMTLAVNFGPVALATMPFTCRMLQTAAQADVEVLQPPKVGKPEVVFPVGLPNEGTFAWLDDFLKANPKYTELSCRSLLNWALKSGMQRGPKGGCGGSNDRPNMDLGVRELDEYGLLATIFTMAPMLRRDFVVMEVENNLIKDRRAALLESFNGDDFKKVAMVVMGEPVADFKQKAQEQMLGEKRQKAGDEARRLARQELERKKEEAKKKEAASTEKKDGETEDVEMKAEEDKNEEGTELDDATIIEEAVKAAEDAVELSTEEQSKWFPKAEAVDVAIPDFNRNFGNYTAPEAAEGFDEVRYAWQPADKCNAYLKTWISDRKLTQRIEDLQPGQWFKEALAEWDVKLQEWRKAQTDRREPMKRTAADRPKEQGDGNADVERITEGDAADSENKEITLEDVDPFLVENIMDIGNGQPLFAKFTWEDWAMLSLRYEVHLLVHAYKADVADEERPSFHESHLSFYYNRYFRRHLNSKNFGVDSNVELINLVLDTLEVDPKHSILEPQLSSDSPIENFVRLTEDHRRERQRRTDLGDESAALRLRLQRSPQRPQASAQPPSARVDYRGGQQNRGDRQGAPYRNDRGMPQRGGDYRGGPPPGHGQPSRGGSHAGGPSSRGGGPPPMSSDRYRGGPSGGDFGRGGGGGGHRGGPYSGGHPSMARGDRKPYPQSRDSRGGPPQGRHRSPPHPPPHRSGGGGHAGPSSAPQYGGQKRSYPSSGGGGGFGGPPPYKQQRGGGGNPYNSGPPGRGGPPGGRR